MPRAIDRAGVLQLMAAGATIIEVLPEEEFGEAHLPGAINVPLKQLSAASLERIDPAQPVIVYCQDQL